MRTFSPLFLLHALGALSVAFSGVALADEPSEWKCESCPFEKAAGVTGSVELGVGNVSDKSAKFGDYTGLDKKGAYAIAGGDAQYRRDDGHYADVNASDLGIDTRSISAVGGKYGAYKLRLGYDEIPHTISDTGRTPFIGNGSSTQTLPAGFPVATTAAIPDSALQPVDIGFKHSRIDFGASWFDSEHWTHRVNASHDVRDGTKRTSGSFFSTTSQLVAPVDQATDQIEVSTSYAAKQWQVSLGYYGSLFHNADQSLTWANPFNPVTPGATSGQLALAPDNQFHQIFANGSYNNVLPGLHASGEFAAGRMTQDAAYLSPTLNATLGATVPALPTSSLNGRVDTFNGSARLAYDATEKLRLNASYTYNIHDNRTDSLSYPAVTTDMLLGATPRTNQPFDFKQYRYKFDANYRALDWLKASLGAEEDDRMRTLQDTVWTREGSLWGRVVAQWQSYATLTMKYQHGQRANSGYGSATWVSPAENPYMRKYNLADRIRDTTSVRVDITAMEGITFGLHADISHDNYEHSTVGLTDGRSDAYGGDVSADLTETTRLQFFVQSERLRSQQAGSSSATYANWTAQSDDVIDVAGIGLKQLAMAGKLEFGADWAYTRTHSDLSVAAGPSDPPFPTATTALDSIKLYATYQVRSNIWINGAYWYESYRSQDWRLDGVTPTTVPNLLVLGEQSPNYHVNVVRVAMRYRF